MEQEWRKKLIWLLLGILLLIVLVLAGKKGMEREREPAEMPGEENHLPQEPPQAQVEPKPIPIPEYNGRIRVLLKTKDYGGVYHEEVQITDGEQSWSFQKEGDTYYLNGEPLKDSALPMRLEASEDGRLTLSSLERACGQPAYEGSLEVYGTGEGFVLVNELSLEKYLKYVVPSEMPASYELEALKAQAVCARTYACMQMGAYAYPDYLAHVDDSVGFQVYHNLEEGEQSSQAVAETEGQVMTYEGQVINAYYFSTSCGHTGNEDVWWNGDSSQTPYLQGKSVNGSGEVLDLSGEEDFAAFLEQEDEGCYDRDMSWYRWEAHIDVDTLSDHMNEGLMSRYQANPEAIVNWRGGKFVSAPVKSVGKIQEIQVLERGAGGVLQKIEVRGSRRTVQIMTEYNIRALLNGNGEIFYRGDGSQAKGGALLPSGYFTITPEYEGEELVGFLFQGGGLGHGVGMSQNGANQMAKEGWNYSEILKFFYTGVDLTPVSALY